MCYLSLFLATQSINSYFNGFILKSLQCLSIQWNGWPTVSILTCFDSIIGGFGVVEENKPRIIGGFKTGFIKI